MLFDLLKDIQSNLGDRCYLGKLPSKESIDAANGIYISLLSVNENGGIQRPVLPVNNEYKSAVHSLDLYIVITAYNNDYEAGLRALDRVMEYFNDNSHHSLPVPPVNYTVQLANLSMEQNIVLRQDALIAGLPGIIYKITTARQPVRTGD